jgi:hypothetical protein
MIKFLCFFGAGKQMWIVILSLGIFPWVKKHLPSNLTNLKHTIQMINISTSFKLIMLDVSSLGQSVFVQKFLSGMAQIQVLVHVVMIETIA